jgi:2-polyprenyl-6-methoxyphenol hydroxylase-like FAD-dependent oxidoreductase
MAHILISGAGIAGLTLAGALRRAGHEVEIVERSPTWEVVGAGIMVHANGMRVLRALGLDVQEAGAVVRRWEFHDQRGDLLCATDLAALWGDVGPCVGIERTRLHDVLRGAADVPCRLGVTVTSIDDGGSVTFSDGTAGSYDLVVGADGVASGTRALTFGSRPPIYGDQMVWRSVAPVRPLGLTELQFHLGDGCFFGLCPVGDGGTYGFGNMSGERFHDPVAGRLARLRARFKGFGAAVQEFLAALERDEQVHCAPVEWLELDEWRRGRLLLVGDAAHASSPMMGQGGCMALEDALVLAEALGAATIDEALDTYVRRRLPRVRWVHEQSRAAGELFRVPPAARDARLRADGDSLLRARYAPLVSPP